MKLKLLMLGVAAVTIAACGEKEAQLESVEQRLSYMVGNNMAKQFKRDEVQIDTAALQAGISDAYEDKESRLSEEQIQETIATLQERAKKRQEALRAEQDKERSAQAEKNKTEGEAYLTANAEKEGVVVTDSGLQYEVLASGDGSAKPTADDTVSVSYKGTLIDGTEFDSSESATFPVSGVIAGWVEALQLMSKGDKWKLTIPSGLAYGEAGAGPGGPIGPNATLVFEVQLLDIVKPEPAAEAN